MAEVRNHGTQQLSPTTCLNVFFVFWPPRAYTGKVGSAPTLDVESGFPRGGCVATPFVLFFIDTAPVQLLGCDPAASHCFEEAICGGVCYSLIHCCVWCLLIIGT